MKPRTWFIKWKEKADALETYVFALYLAYRDPRTPWYAKVLALAVASYALCPIDLIPDFIPVLGYLDDLLILPGGVLLVLKLVPPDVMTDCRSHAAEMQTAGAPQFQWMGPVVILLWVVAVALVSALIMSLTRH